MKEMCHFPFCGMSITAPQADQQGVRIAPSTGSRPTAHRDLVTGMRKRGQKIKEINRNAAENVAEHITNRIITREKNGCKNGVGIQKMG